MAKKREPKPLIEITPENLAALKQYYILSVDNFLRIKYCHLIDSIAADKGWDLDELEWIHEDGRLFKGLKPIMSRMEVYRKLQERDLEIQYVVEVPEKSQVLVILKQPRTEGDVDRYQCIRYFEIDNDLTHSYDASGVDIDVVFKWLGNPRAIPTDGME